MKQLLGRLLRNKQKENRLQQPIIPTELLEEINILDTFSLSTMEITEEMFLSADVFDYSVSSYERHKRQIQKTNLIQRQIEMSDILGIDWYNQSREDNQRINDNIIRCRTIGRIDGLYNLIEKE